jgi:signal peptidase II
MIWIVPMSVLLLVGLDQWTKYLAIYYLKDQMDFVIWPKVFQLAYVENRGAAFGILQNRILFFVILTAIVLIAIFLYWRHIPLSKTGLWMKGALVLVISGAIGNLIDRIFRGYVVDFFYFSLIDFPVFNIADICVVVGVGLLVPIMLWGNLEEGKNE